MSRLNKSDGEGVFGGGFLVVSLEGGSMEFDGGWIRDGLVWLRFRWTVAAVVKGWTSRVWVDQSGCGFWDFFQVGCRWVCQGERGGRDKGEEDKEVDPV